MTFTFESIVDHREHPITKTELARYKQDSQRAMADRTRRIRTSYRHRIIDDIKENGCNYLAAILIVSLAAATLVFWQAAYAAPQCSAYHLIGNTAFCLN